MYKLCRRIYLIAYHMQRCVLVPTCMFANISAFLFHSILCLQPLCKWWFFLPHSEKSMKLFIGTCKNRSMDNWCSWVTWRSSRTHLWHTLYILIEISYLAWWIGFDGNCLWAIFEKKEEVLALDNFVLVNIGPTYILKYVISDIDLWSCMFDIELL